VKGYAVLLGYPVVIDFRYRPRGPAWHMYIKDLALRIVQRASLGIGLSSTDIVRLKKRFNNINSEQAIFELIVV
jgi:hypothetical protein